MFDYNSTYSTCQNVFGTEPERILVEHIHLLDTSRPILDIGAGQGRNAILPASKGFKVYAVEPVEAAVKQIESLSIKENLPITIFHCDFENFPLDNQEYSAIFMFGLLQTLSPKSVEILKNKVEEWSDEKTHLFLTAWSTQDPTFPEIANSWKRIASNHFTDGKGNFRFYLQPNQITSIFPNFKTLHHWEGLGPWHRHGNGDWEHHGKAEAVLVKNK